MHETQELQVGSLGWEDPLEEEMVTDTSILAWRIPSSEEPGGLQSIGSQRVGHNWARTQQQPILRGILTHCCISSKEYFSELEKQLWKVWTMPCEESWKKLRIFSLMNAYLRQHENSPQIAKRVLHKREVYAYSN